MSQDPEIEYSPLCQSLSSGGRTIQVKIYRLAGEALCVLEVEDEFSNSTVWDDLFESDAAALIEVKKTILEERIGSFTGPKDGKGSW